MKKVTELNTKELCELADFIMRLGDSVSSNTEQVAQGMAALLDTYIF